MPAVPSAIAEESRQADPTGTPSTVTFAALQIDNDIVEALAGKGIIEPFPIQAQTIPLGLTGQDIIGQAKTGTGKTLGFGLPLIQRLGAEPGPGVKALVVVPTRELCIQVAEDLELAASNRPTKVTAIYGGKAYEEQIDALKDGAQIVVATPGRLIDLNQQRMLDLSHVETIVLDEADKMLDLGFLPDIEKIFSKVPEVRHTMLFSATMPGPIVALARRFMNRPIHIRATDPDEGKTQANIKHVIYRAHSLDKDEVIARILQAEGRGKTVVFTRTKRAAAKLVEELNDRGFPAVAVHGDLSQEQRERAMAAFRAGKKEILIATDVAARGIDVDDVTHVINHTVPDDPDTYLHRVGRTGRAGKTGIAVTFVDWDDLHKWRLIDKGLEMNVGEPAETYSSSPHLFADLNIPEGTKGRLPGSHAPAVREGARRERTDGGRERTRSRSGQSQAERREGGADGGRDKSHSRPSGRQSRSEPHIQQHESGEGAPAKRRRRRRRSGGGEAQAASETPAS